MLLTTTVSLTKEPLSTFTAMVATRMAGDDENPFGLPRRKSLSFAWPENTETSTSPRRTSVLVSPGPQVFTTLLTMGPS